MTIEVDLANKDALRALKEINRGKTVSLKEREACELHDANAYEVCGDGMALGMFINLYVDGTWTASANIALSGE